MSMRYQAAILTASYFPLKTPDAPINVTASAGDTTASVSFTAPSNIGGGAITGYTVTSTPSGITATGSSSPITVTGLTNGTTYTFKVVATNAYGAGPASAASNGVVPVVNLSVDYLVVAGGGAGGCGNGGGGGGAGGLIYSTSSVPAGTALTVTVGAGGAGANNSRGSSGSTSVFHSITATGGGGGGGSDQRAACRACALR